MGVKIREAIEILKTENGKKYNSLRVCNVVKNKSKLKEI